MAVPQTAYNTLMGMFRPQQAPAGASVMEQAQADARNQMLGRLGFGLLAAAIPQTAAQRTQALQQAFGGMGDMGTNVYNAAQARLMAQKAETTAAQEAAQRRFFAQGGVANAPVSVRDGGFAAGTAPISMPGTTQFPGGLSAQDWSAVQYLGGISPESGTALFSSLVEKRAKDKGDSQAETYGTVMYITDQATGLPQAVLPKKGGGYVPIAAPGQAIDPASAAYLKAQGAKAGTLKAESIAGAPAEIAQAELNLQNIDLLLQPGVIESAVGPFVGTTRPEDVLGMARNIYTGGKFGASVALIDQIDFGSFAEGVKLFEGKGALSDAEGKVARGIKARLTRAQSAEKFREALNQFKAIVEVGKARSELLLQTNPATGKPYTDAEAKQVIPPIDAMLGDGEPTPTPQQPPSNTSGIATIQSEAEYNALPSGTVFKAPDGSVRTKP